MKRIARHGLLLFWIIAGLAVMATSARAEDTTLRLVAVINQDDHGESIDFPHFLHHDHWASETYLISSSGRITIYDQNFFPVASFGMGRGLRAPRGLTVDRRGNIYVCQALDELGIARPRLTIYNQAFFPVREIDFAMIPELVGFAAERVAVAESGEIYLAGSQNEVHLSKVAVLAPEGSFLRFLLPPEKNALRVRKKVPAAEGDKKPPPAASGRDGAEEPESSPDLPAGLKPKSSARGDGADEEREGLELPYIYDVKIDRQGRIYLLSLEVSNIFVFSAREEFLFKFGEKGGADRKLSNPMGLAIDQERQVIYVNDYMRHTILCYDYGSGNFVFEFGGQGRSPLWFNFPNSIAVDQRGRVIVSDLFNRRLQVIDPNLEVRRPVLAASPAGPTPPPGPSGAAAAPALLVAPPPGLAALVTPPWGAVPAAVLIPALPPPSLPVPPSPPLRVHPLAPRELAPHRLKKPGRRPGALREPIITVPLRAPELMAKPGGVRFPPRPLGQDSRSSAGPGALLLAQFRALPAAVGVYGPVAVMLGVGARLLGAHR